MANFEAAFEKTIKHEGGYVFDPDDNGGETKYGISASSYPNLNIRALTLDMAKLIYQKDYWEKIQGDRIANQQLAEQIFDMAVNSGVGMASKIIQRIVGAEDDGIIGDKTLPFINQAGSILDDYKLWRIKFYMDLCSSNKSQRKFLYSWIKRVL